jgi:hypothetical protein
MMIIRMTLRQYIRQMDEAGQATAPAGGRWR